MTQEEKQILLRDLCGRLPYGVKLSVNGGDFDSFQHPCLLTAISKFGSESLCKVYHPIYTSFGCPKIEDVKPYLRPMSSMTEEEKEELKYVIELELQALEGEEGFNTVSAAPAAFEVDFYNKHHLDYRGLIEKGLALEASEGIYKNL